ncbi:MAG: hypothetical protein KME35_16065 [Aphanocapsa sp. GSE-SYN-MK-11-07L]|jgi:hypothetical protein|nr:hypothetical protein [Aphanocapsa sp. GSE-SYN-MK-11-07L]
MGTFEIPDFVPSEFRLDILPREWLVDLNVSKPTPGIPVVPIQAPTLPLGQINAAVDVNFFAYQLALHWFIKFKWKRGYRVPYDRHQDCKAVWRTI